MEADVADRGSAPSKERHLPVELAMKRSSLLVGCAELFGDSGPPLVTKTAIAIEAGREKGRYNGVTRRTGRYCWRAD